MMNNFLYSLFALIIILSCVASPRYSSNPNKTSSENKVSKSTKSSSNPPSSNYRRYSSNSSSKIRSDVITGISSWYGPNFHGKLTANGEVFDQYGVTAAHKTLPFGTKVRVFNPTNKKFVDVIINDRGPFIKGRIIEENLP